MIALPLGLYALAVALLYRWLAAPGWSRGDRWRWALAWGPALAFGLPSCALFAARWCGLEGALPWVLGLCGGVGALEMAVRRGRGAATAGEPSGESAAAGAAEGGLGAPPSSDFRALRVLSGLRLASALLLAVTAVLLLQTFHTWQRAQPEGMWDAMAIWNANARFLARAEVERLPAIFATLSEGHPEYPLLLGASVAAQWELGGAESSAVPLGMCLAFALGLAAALHLLVRLCGAKWFAGAAVLLVFSTPAIWKWAFAQVADLPLAYMACAAALPLVAALQMGLRPGPPAVLSGLVFGFLPWTKVEGLLVAAALAGPFVGLVLLRGRPRPEMLRRPFLWVLGTVPGVLALVLFQLTWAPAVAARASFLRGGGKWKQLLDPERWSRVAEEVLRHLDPRDGAPLWGFVWPLLGLGLLFWGGRLRWRTAPGAVLLAAAAMTTFACYVLAFVLSPFDLAWHLASALDRLLMHLLPLAVAVVCGLGGAGPEAAAEWPRPR